MVHALREAHRVLRPKGLLIDIRPAPVHRRVGVLGNRRWELVARMKENLADDRAANAAMKTVIDRGLFRREAYLRMDLSRHIGTLPNLRAWLDEFAALADFPPHGWMVDQVKNALSRAPAKARIVARGPIEVRTMRKVP